MASFETMQAYRAEAARKVVRARAQFPQMRPLEALFKYVADYPDRLTPNTVRLWRQQMRIAVLEVSNADSRSFTERQVDQFTGMMDEAVLGLKGRPSQPKTATKKWKDPAKKDVVKVFVHLKQRALTLNRGRMAATALYCVLMPRLGGRPIELVGARVDGDRLIFRNAKRAAGQDVERSIDISGWNRHYRVALAALIDFTSAEVTAGGYEAWHSAMAETLARACQAVSVQRIAPSSFRHTALSTWSAAGFSINEIAKLAGHFSTRSPDHYIRTAAAWGQEDVVVNTNALLPTLSPPGVEVTGADVSGYEIAPLPQPLARPSKADDTQRLIKEHRQRFQEFEKKLDEAVEARTAAGMVTRAESRDPNTEPRLSRQHRKP